MRTGAEPGGEIRCPACSRLLVLRSGPKVAPHYAHRPRQSCRNRPGGAGRAPLRLEQLTLFELPPLGPPPIAAVLEAFIRRGPTPVGDETPLSRPSPPRARRRRRRAWLPRLLRWCRGGRGPASPGLHP